MPKPRRKPSVPDLEWLAGGRDGEPLELERVLTREGGEQRYIYRNVGGSPLLWLAKHGKITQEEAAAGAMYERKWRIAFGSHGAVADLEAAGGGEGWRRIVPRREEAHDWITRVNRQLGPRDLDIVYHVAIKASHMEALTLHCRRRYGVRWHRSERMPAECSNALFRLARAIDAVGGIRVATLEANAG